MEIRRKKKSTNLLPRSNGDHRQNMEDGIDTGIGGWRGCIRSGHFDDIVHGCCILGLGKIAVVRLGSTRKLLKAKRHRRHCMLAFCYREKAAANYVLSTKNAAIIAIRIRLGNSGRQL